jgi:hypothetical protein
MAGNLEKQSFGGFRQFYIGLMLEEYTWMRAFYK